MLAVFRGQTLISPAIVPVVGPIVSLFMAKPRSVIVTETSVITVQESMWFEARAVRLVSRYRRGSVQLQLSRFGLKVGEDRRIFASLGAFPAMKRAVLLGSKTSESSSGPGAD